MKQFTILLLTLFTMVGCSKEQTTTTDWTPITSPEELVKYANDNVFEEIVELTPPCETEYSNQSFIIEGGGFVLGQTRTGLFSIENYGDSVVCGNLTIIIAKPLFTVMDTEIPTVNGNITIFGFNVDTNNGEWDIISDPNSPIIQMTSNTDIVTSSNIEISFTRIGGVINQQPQVLGLLLTGSGGDTNDANNGWQQTFLF